MKQFKNRFLKFLSRISQSMKVHIDADNVADNACEELHEDAYEQCDIGSLQNLLDVWCKDQTGTITYYPCYKQYVKIDWSKY